MEHKNGGFRFDDFPLQMGVFFKIPAVNFQWCHVLSTLAFFVYQFDLFVIEFLLEPESLTRVPKRVALLGWWKIYRSFFPGGGGIGKFFGVSMD